jgi:hypothetical protein
MVLQNLNTSLFLSSTSPLLQQVARRTNVVEIGNEPRRRPLAVQRDRAGHGCERGGAVLSGVERRGQHRLALALEHGIDRAFRVLQQGFRRERGAVAANEDEASRQPQLRDPGEVDDLRHVREVVAGERDRVGLPIPKPALEGAVALDLEIDEAHLVARAPRGLGRKLETERLQAKKYFRVHERSRMDREDLHERPRLGSAASLCRAWSHLPCGKSRWRFSAP